MTQTRKLNLGCGTDIRADHVNLDVAPLEGVDVVHDIAETPWPLADAEFDEVLCLSVLEHVPMVPALREIHRVLKPGGRAVLSVPHFTAADTWSDPTHIRGYACDSFGFFVNAANRDYYFDFAFSRIAALHLDFSRRRLFLYNRPLEWLVNRSAGMRAIYERSPLRAFPATNIRVTLEK
jgi:SAM-dependent methyltransferase